MNTIAEKWAEYNSFVMHKDAGYTQRIETKRAFYAGALAYMRIALNAAEEGISEEAGALILLEIEKEIKLFGAQVIKGEA